MAGGYDKRMARIILRVAAALLVAISFFVASMLGGVTVFVPLYQEKVVSRLFVDAIPYASVVICLVAAWLVDRAWNPRVVRAIADDKGA